MPSDSLKGDIVTHSASKSVFGRPAGRVENCHDYGDLRSWKICNPSPELCDDFCNIWNSKEIDFPKTQDDIMAIEL